MSLSRLFCCISWTITQENMPLFQEKWWNVKKKISVMLFLMVQICFLLKANCRIFSGGCYVWYWVILQKVSFGIFRTFLVSREDKNFTIESKDKGLSLSKFSWYLGIVKIIKIRHSKGHISQTNHDLKNISMQK